MHVFGDGLRSLCNVCKNTFKMHDVDSGMFGISVGKRGPGITSGLSGSNKRNNGGGYGSKDCVEEQLILPGP